MAVNRSDVMEEFLVQMLDGEITDDDLKEDTVIQIDPGTILEKEYKGNTVKVKVLKDGSFSYNGKQYEDRGSLMKAILKGKTGQFTTFFGLNKNGNDKPKKVTKSAPVISEDGGSGMDSSNVWENLENHIRMIVRSEVNSILNSKFGGNN